MDRLYRALGSGVASRRKQAAHEGRFTSSTVWAVCLAWLIGCCPQGRLLVGHAIHNDLQALQLSHPHKLIRDTAKYPPLMRVVHNGKRKPKPRALRKLAAEQLGFEIQVQAWWLCPVSAIQMLSISRLRSSA